MEFQLEGEEFANEVVGVAGDLLDEFVLRVEGPSLGDLVVHVSVKFEDLRVPVVVEDVSPEHFNADSFPSLDIVFDGPSVSNVGGLESSVDYDVGIGIVPDQSHIVDGDAFAVRFASSFDLELVLSSLYIDVN